ncbi:vascular endothelial growth factor C isoform X4 [Xiphias gladius]|uniref:vascular endothelial growth factor C isoform X4 n=1 Tax=Xiphias gladius TaxID=8245 RepID=UPI001A98BE3F|nr:vascular endothelial growth factor C isoform X4 [Xiphias gladius]
MHLLGISLLLAYLLYTNLASDFSFSDYHDYYEEQMGMYDCMVEEDHLPVVEEDQLPHHHDNKDTLPPSTSNSSTTTKGSQGIRTWTISDDPAEWPSKDSPPKPDMEQKLRSASSVDELMSLIYPSYWATLKCRSKLSAATASSASKLTQRPQPRQLRPLAVTEEPTFAAAYLNLDVLKSIESEWRKTQCMPREVCVDVGREFGAPTNIFYKPPCVSVYRCGGCCHSEDKQCRNISTGYLSKTLFEIMVPITQGTRPVTISVANHTQCSCLSKLDVYKQVHSIIRRALPECPIANRTCPPGQAWSSRLCLCVSMAANIHHNTPPLPLPPPTSSQQHLDIFSSDVCGPDKELDVETCQCVCWRGDQTQDCGPNRHLNRNTCQCVCNVPPAPSCPLNHVFNTETCQCTCIKTCPRHQPLNKTKCSCECNESPNKCFLKGRRFHQATCRTELTQDHHATSMTCSACPTLTLKAAFTCLNTEHSAVCSLLKVQWTAELHASS